MIYLDYSATTPVHLDVLDSYNKVTKEYYGNPNSLHSLGVKSKELLNEAMKQIADILKVKVDEVIITSGATASNNMAIIGAALSKEKKGKTIIVSKLEHDSVYGICDYLKSIGFNIKYVNNDQNGVIDFNHLKKLIDSDTILVSICGVNSELGIKQPLKTIRQVIKKENENIIFHSDLTQGLCKTSINLNDVDLASFSGHKIYAPKGIGILYKKKGINITPLLYGSNNDLNPGTPPLPLIASLSKAVRIGMSDLDKKELKVSKYNTKIKNYLKKHEDILINQTTYSIPHILNISLINIKPETMLHALEKHNIFVGTNTACSSGKISASVYNLYEDKKRALSTIRISLSHETTDEEINIFLNVFDSLYEKLNKLN